MIELHYYTHIFFENWYDNDNYMLEKKNKEFRSMKKSMSELLLEVEREKRMYIVQKKRRRRYVVNVRKVIL